MEQQRSKQKKNSKHKISGRSFDIPALLFHFSSIHCALLGGTRIVQKMTETDWLLKTSVCYEKGTTWGIWEQDFLRQDIRFFCTEIFFYMGHWAVLRKIVSYLLIINQFFKLWQSPHLIFYNSATYLVIVTHTVWRCENNFSNTSTILIGIHSIVDL